MIETVEKDETTVQPNSVIGNQTVYVVDDDNEICEALTWLLESADIKVKRYTCGIEFLKSYNGEPGCIVLDVRMKNISGLKLQEKLIENNHDIPIIFITGHGDVQMAVRAMKNGAVEFFTKPFNSQDLLESVQAILENNRKEEKKQQEKHLILQRLRTLTSRENDILVKVVEGKSSKIIAKELEISVHTVELHRANIMKKMDVNAVAELVRLVMLYNIA